jgi:hypothetical protein
LSDEGFIDGHQIPFLAVRSTKPTDALPMAPETILFPPVETYPERRPPSAC